MAQFGEALKSASERSARDRLEEVVFKAMIDHAGSMYATEEAIWAAVRRDRNLLEAVVSPIKHRVMSDLIHQVRRERLGYNPAVGSGATIHIPSEEHHGEADTPLKKRAQMVSTTWDREHKGQLTKERDAEIARLTERRAWRDRWQATAAAHIQINDKPFWTVCVNEARGWIDRTAHEARFMELVIAGVPDDGRPIEYYRKPEEIDALWQQAEPG
ncbi:MAG: hypothetical protein ABSC06_39315 [Rhodopila sp.]|jgi:hypothetical protein